MVFFIPEFFQLLLQAKRQYDVSQLGIPLVNLLQESQLFWLAVLSDVVCHGELCTERIKASGSVCASHSCTLTRSHNYFPRDFLWKFPQGFSTCNRIPMRYKVWTWSGYEAAAWEAVNFNLSSAARVAKISMADQEKKPFERLPTDVVPRNYKLELKPDLKALTFEGKLEITCEVLEEEK